MTSIVSILMVLVACVIGASGAVLLKKEASNVSFRKLHITPLMILGVFFYGVSTIMFILALRGSQLSILYPLVSTTYAWIAVFSAFFLNEKMTKLKIMGISLIFIGVSVIGFFK